MPSKPDVNRDQIIVARYARESAVEIAKSLGITKGTVYNALRRNGVTMKQIWHTLTIVQENEVVRRYAAGESALSISHDFPVNVQTIHNLLIAHGAKNKTTSGPGIRTSDEKRTLVAAACTTGKMTLQEAADAHGISKETASRIVREHRETGGDVMPRGRRPWRTLNERAFDALTPECLYWLGFLFADGCVCHTDERRTPIFAIGLAKKDLSHLEKLRSFLGSNHAISPYTSTTKNGFTKTSVNLHIRSEHLCNKINSYGITTRRPFPPPRELSNSHDFWRGVVDGDGWLGTMTQTYGVYPYVGLSGQRPLLETFQSFITKQGFPKIEIGEMQGCFRISTSGRPAGQIIKTLYGNSTEVLKRKDVRAQAILSGNLTKFPPYIEEPSVNAIKDDLLAESNEESEEVPEQEPSDLD